MLEAEGVLPELSFSRVLSLLVEFVGEGDEALGAQADLGEFESLLSICFLHQVSGTGF